jgi:exoribonuclease R
MRADETSQALLHEGFRAIRLGNGVIEGDAGTPALRELAATIAIDSDAKPGFVRRDATDLELVTLDPASSTDLDQAYAVVIDGENAVLSYAIADIGAFVPRGSELEADAWTRGVTVYSPDGSVPLYPRVLSQQRASLLPDGSRPAVLLTVIVDPFGTATLKNVERVFVRSRAKLAYENVTDADLSPAILELAKRINDAEGRRGAFRVERPVQEVFSDASANGALKTRFAPRRISEDRNSTLSLAANQAVAQFMFDHGVGLYRVMDEPDENELAMLRRRAKALGFAWPPDESLHEIVARIDPENPKHMAFAIAIRRAGGGAKYVVLPEPALDNISTQNNLISTQNNSVGTRDIAVKPWHAAMAAIYAHATAPMRRLADRYVLDLLIAQHDGDTAAVAELTSTLAKLPKVMGVADKRASKVDRDCIELVENAMLEPFIGQELEATVVDAGHDGVQIQIDQPAVLARIRPNEKRFVNPGDLVKVRVKKGSLELT